METLILWMTFVATVLIGVIGLIHSHQSNEHFAEQNQIMLAELHGNAIPATAHIHKPSQWHIVGMILIMLGVWSLVGFDYWDRHYHTQTNARVFVNWGTGAGTICSATVNGLTLDKWKDKYHVVLVCGFTDPTIDQFRDSRITVTKTFTIQDGPIVMSALYSKEMAESINILLDQARKTAPTSPKGMKIQLTWAPWYDVIVLPLQADTSDIHTLADISRLGGEVVDSASMAVAQ